MEKNWLVIADIHIDDYPQFNFSHRARLNQFTKLAHRIVELGGQYDCPKLVIAGDLINKPTNRPYVTHVINEFISIINRGFDQIYYILGQHCVDAKNDNINPEDTILSIYDSEKFKYMDHQVLVTESGKRIAFKDWTPKQDLSWIEDKVDVLFAHYTKSELFGQEIDESKFDLMIHGDIHNSQELGKYISIGNPIQHNMSSQQRGTCIVFNPNDCTWVRVGVDDDHTRFLRIDYTNDQSEEGFEGELKYHIYKPYQKSITTQSSATTIEYTEVEDLITEIVAEEGLNEVHCEVKGLNPIFTETDFNFQLKSLKIHGYRSIVDFELKFDGNDRIILVGNNGSGKSSIVKALKSVFDNSRFIKNEQSDFTDSLRVDLEFTYQNKLYHLWKGSSEWGLEIDGKEIGYNNKTEFENDIKVQLPFLGYLDLFFITSDVQNLSSQFNPDRRIELLSKFYRLDRIEAYSKAAEELRNKQSEQIQQQRDELNRTAGRLDSINARLSELSMYEGKTREEYSSEVDRLNNLLSSHQTHNNWESKLSLLESNISHHESSLEEYRKRMTLNVSECESIIESDKKKIERIKEEQQNIRVRSNRLKELTAIRTESYNTGMRLKTEVESLKSGVCPTCGTTVCNDHTKAKLAQYESELSNARNRFSDTIEEYNTYTDEEKQPNYYVQADKKLSDALSELNDEIMLLSNKLTQYQIAHKDYESAEKKYQEARQELVLHKASEPSNPEVPVDIQQKIFSATSELTKFDNYQSELSNKDDAEQSIVFIKDEMSKIQSKIDQYQAYIQLTARSGRIMKVILERMAETFSDGSMKYEVESGVFRNKPYIKFNSYFKVKSNWRLYESLSDGQKSISDLDFLNKLFSVQVGVLVLDETLKHLDYQMGPLAWDIISKMNVNSILVSTHDANFATFTKKISLMLNEQGHTINDI